MIAWSTTGLPGGGMPTAPFWARTLHRWNAVSWALFGVLSLVSTVADRTDGAGQGWWLGVLAVIAVCYATLTRFPDNPVLRPHTYLLVLALALGALSYLREGYVALFIVTVPHFWMYGRRPRDSAAFSGLASVLTLVGSTCREGWDLAFFSTSFASTAIVFLASALIGLWVLAVIAQSEERARLIVELEQAQAELAAAHQRQGAADERERLARDIHDTLAQGFASIVVLAEAARSGLDAEPARSAQQLHSIEQTARENLAEARELVASGHAAAPSRGSAAEPLRRTLDRFAEDTGLEVTAELADVVCDQPTRIALLRCAQESLANVRKHAGASAVGVVLSEQGAVVELEITDDGTGFAVADAEERGFGLRGMRRRLTELGGDLKITSSLGNGTRVLAMVPSPGGSEETPCPGGSEETP
ncbi:sensor histidine kinase [Streptomyces albiaxialis]|uniref:Sensor histidine kinase n=1 Tax=Streptomyces albiaxialis TaxID=329523 RepID=A0ABP5H080_9ACTN